MPEVAIAPSASAAAALSPVRRASPHWRNQRQETMPVTDGAHLVAVGGEAFVGDLRGLEAAGHRDPLQHFAHGGIVVGGFDDLRRHRVEPGLRIDPGQPAEPFFEGGQVGDRRLQFEHVAVFGPERDHLAVAGPALVDVELGPGVDLGGRVQDRELDPAPGRGDGQLRAYVEIVTAERAVAPAQFDLALAHRGREHPLRALVLADRELAGLGLDLADALDRQHS